MLVRAGSARVRAAGGTDAGRLRSNNEDRFHLDVDRGIFIVVDGIGGQAAGDTAADIAVGMMSDRLARRGGSMTGRLRDAIVAANNEVHRQAASRADWKGMACVLTAAVVDGNRVAVGHVGDSRLYKLRGTRIEKITPDHSPVGEREDARQLSEAEAMRHPRRNEVYRDVGSEPHAVDDADFAFLNEFEFEDDAALLICSDGLTDLVPAETIREIAVSHAGSPQDVVRALIDAANAEGGKDNITAVFVEGPAFRASVAAPRPHGQARRWLFPVAIVAAACAGLVLGLNFDALGVLTGGSVKVLGWPSGTIVVRSSESIMSAVTAAPPGSDVVVEPGEYRERLTLKDNVRVMSRVPGAVILRLPDTAGEHDPAVTAVGVTNAELTGFRIVGDASTPLGTGVLAHDAGVRLVDLDVTGAVSCAIEIGAGGATDLVGSHIHDNPGSALSIGAGAAPRLVQNVFERNASSERAAAAFVIDRESRPDWSRNVFHGVGPEAIAGTDEAMRSSLIQGNWFVDVRPPATPPRPGGRGGRGR